MPVSVPYTYLVRHSQSMSTTTLNSYAELTLPFIYENEREAALAVYDYVVNHPDQKLPEDLDQLDSDDFVVEVELYIKLDKETLTISRDSEGKNCSYEIFSFLLHHFRGFNTKRYVYIFHSGYDSRNGIFGSNEYMDKETGVCVDVPALLEEKEPADLSNYMLIDTVTGTVLQAHHCVLVPDSALTEQEWRELDDMSDSQIVAIAKEHGVPLKG